jgi:hypothetical protein
MYERQMSRMKDMQQVNLTAALPLFLLAIVDELHMPRANKVTELTFVGRISYGWGRDVGHCCLVFSGPFMV